MTDDKLNFTITQGSSVNSEIEAEIIHEYKTNKKLTKVELRKHFNKKYGIGENTFNKIIAKISNREKYYLKITKKGILNNIQHIIDETGGIELIKALVSDGWTQKSIYEYFMIGRRSLVKYLKKHELDFKSLKRNKPLKKKSVLTKQDIIIVKESHNIGHMTTKEILGAIK